MEGWKDGRMEQKIECKRNGKQKNAQSVDNKSAAAPRAKNQLLSGYLCRAVKYTTRTNKASRAHQKAAKKRRFRYCAHIIGNNQGQYKCDTSVLRLYYSAALLYWGLPLCHTPPLRCLLKKFFLKILALE